MLLFPSQFIFKGTQGRNLEVGADAEAKEGWGAAA